MLVCLLGFSLLCLYIPIYASKQHNIAQEAFFNKAPDLIAVFTGDAGRIDYALKLAEQYPSAKLFVSGVHTKNSLKTLLVKQGKGISVDEFLEQEGHHIELDYLSRNTVENGISTLNFLKRFEEYRNVLIISSDYHILRVSLIMMTLNDIPTAKFYFESIRSDYSDFGNIKKIFKEVYKIAKATTFLLFWDKEVSNIP